MSLPPPGHGDLGAVKLTVLVVLYLAIVVVLPGAFADVERAPPELRGFTVLLAVLFAAGVVLAGVALVPLTRSVSRTFSLPDTGVLLALSGVLCVLAAYITLVGPMPPILAAATGYDALQVALLREEALKLNTDQEFVRVYVWARDIVAPVLFLLGIQRMMFARSSGQRALALIALAPAVYVAIWSSQKATLVNYALAALIFVARDARQLLSLSVRTLPLVALLVFGLFLFTYAGFFDADQAGSGGVLASVLSGLIERLFVGPLEVSIAYVDAVDHTRLIDPVDVVPVVGAWLHPGRDIVENVVGQYYFFSGIDSISANALCFAYAYVVGGVVMVMLAGATTVLVLVGMQRLVRTTGNAFVSSAYSALCCYVLLDLLAGNVFSYLLSAAQWGVVALVIGSAARWWLGPGRGAAAPRAS